MAEHLKLLTALRFFAALWVVLFHYWPALQGAAMPAWVGKGYLGVELFFVLSGFILCHVYLGQVESRRFRYGGFLWARVARVYPLHLATLVGVGLLAGAAVTAGLSVDANILSLEALLPNLTLTHAWGLTDVAGWNHPSWSISAEWFAYLTFPASAWLALRFAGRPRLALTAAVLLLVGLYAGFEAVTGELLTQATIAWGALRIVPCFLLGCAAYLAWRGGVVQGRRVGVAGAVACAAGALLLAQLGAPDAATVSLFAGLILCLAAAGQGVGDGSASRLFVWLGEISYALYMVCIPWDLLAGNALPKLLGDGGETLPLLPWLLLPAGAIALAAAAHHLIERPARTRLRAVGERFGGTPVSAALRQQPA